MAGPPAHTLAALLEEPFGPYDEREALSDAVHNTTVKNPVALRCVTLESGGIITGLSECEPTMPERDEERFNRHPVRFMGTLEIRSLSWLVPDIVKEIEAELTERDVQSRRSPKNPRPQRSNLTLKTLYAPSPGFRTGRYKVKVTIQAWMNGTANYLLSEDVPNGLRISSRDRNYAVKTMLIHTYELSRLYLSRWRLVACAHRLVELERTANTLIPPEERTPDWYIDSYFKYYAYHPSGRRFRAVNTESDSDIEPGTDGRMKDGREHPVRHVSRAEMESLFAQHAVWIIGETRKVRRTSTRLFDPDKWQAKWLPEVRRTREIAAASGRRWGTWEGSEIPIKDPEDIPLPPAPSKRKRATAKKGKRTTAQSWDATTHYDGGRFDDNAMDVDGAFPDPASLRVYDSDFSHSSSDNEAPPTSDEEGDMNVGLNAFTDPEILALIPPSFRHLPPRPPTHKWKCTECDYMIDLLNLTEYDLDNPMISYYVRQRLRSKKWNMFTEEGKWVYDAFLHMVDRHNVDHLEEWGIAFRKIPGGYTAVWKDDRRPQSSRLRQVKVDDRRQKETVKTEEV